MAGSPTITDEDLMDCLYATSLDDYDRYLAEVFLFWEVVILMHRTFPALVVAHSEEAAIPIRAKAGELRSKLFEDFMDFVVTLLWTSPGSSAQPMPPDSARRHVRAFDISNQLDSARRECISKIANIFPRSSDARLLINPGDVELQMLVSPAHGDNDEEISELSVADFNDHEQCVEWHEVVDIGVGSDDEDDRVIFTPSSSSSEHADRGYTSLS